MCKIKSANAEKAMKMTTNKIKPIISEAAKTIKCRSLGIVNFNLVESIPNENLSFTRDKRIQMNIPILEKYVVLLEKYLEKKPFDIEVRTQVARLKEMIKVNSK